MTQTACKEAAGIYVSAEELSECSAVAIWYFDGDADFCDQILRISKLSISTDLTGATLLEYIIQTSHL